MSASTPALPSVPTASGKRKGRSRRKPAALPVSPMHHPPQSLSDAVFSVESTDDAGSSLGKPRGSHTMPNLVSAPSFHFASRFNTGLGRERRPQGARELAHVCNELPAESPRQAALRDAALARVRMRQTEGVRRFDSSLLDTGSGLSTWAAYSDSGASRPTLPDDHSAVHADVSWTSVPAGDLDLARHVERKRLQNGFSMELPVAPSIDAGAYEGKPSRTTGEHRAVGRRSSDLSSLTSDVGSRPKRSRTKQRQQRQRRRRGEASRLYPGMSAADSVIVQDHSRRHKVRATRMVSWGAPLPYCVNWLPTTQGTYQFLSRKSRVSRQRGLHGLVSMSSWHATGLGESGGGAWWGNRSSQGRPASRGSTFRPNTRPPSPVPSTTAEEKQATDGSDADEAGGGGEATIHIRLPAPSLPENPNAAPDLTYWRFLGGQGPVVVAAELAHKLVRRHRQSHAPDGGASLLQPPQSPSAATRFTHRDRWFGYGRSEVVTHFRLTKSTATKLLSSSPVKPDARGDWAELVTRNSGARRTLQGSDKNVQSATLMALSVLREETHQDKRRKRGRPSTDNGLMFRRVVRIPPERCAGSDDPNPVMAIVAVSAVPKESAPTDKGANGATMREARRSVSGKQRAAKKKGGLQGVGDGVRFRVYLPRSSSAMAVSLTNAEMTCVGVSCCLPQHHNTHGVMRR